MISLSEQERLSTEFKSVLLMPLSKLLVTLPMLSPQEMLSKLLSMRKPPPLNS